MEKYSKNRDIFIKRLLLIVVGFLFSLLVFDKTSLAIVFGIIILASVYAFWLDKIWLFLVVTVPSLIFGKVLFIPITSGWIYEAHLAEALLILVFGVFALDIFLNQKYTKLKIDKLSVWLFAYLIISVLSVVSVIDFRLFIFGLKAVVFSFLGYFLAMNLFDTTKKIYWFLYGLTVTAIVLSTQVFLKFYLMGFSSEFFFNRSNILLPIAPIATSAAILALLAPLLLAFYFELGIANRWKPIVFLAFFMAFLAVFLTLGKGAILSLFIGLFYIFYNFKGKRLAFILFLIWFLALAFFGFTPYFTGLLQRIQTAFVDTNTEYRMTEYKVGWDLVTAHPWLGSGIGQQIYHFQKMLDQEQGNYVNNFFWQALIDLGVIGLIILLLIIKNIFTQIKKAGGLFGKKSILAIGFIASIITAFFNGMVEVTFFALPYAIIFWLMVGVFSSSCHSREGGNPGEKHNTF